MKIHIACIGKLRERYLREAESEYLKRLRSHCKVTVDEYKTEAALRGALPSPRLLVALDERGETPSSEEFAQQLLDRERQFGGGRPVVFAIGAADGHSEELRSMADRLISFGRLTIAHRLVRVLLLEQIYRGFSILAGDPYHRA